MNDAVVVSYNLETLQYAHEMHEHDVLRAIAEIEKLNVSNDKWRSAVNLIANGCQPISISERELNHLNAAIKFVPASAKLTGHR